MRSHLAVYRAPENANVNCQFARYALHHPPPPTQQQCQRQQPHALWSTVPHPSQPAVARAAAVGAVAPATTAAAACYNLRAQLHHGLYHAAAAASPPPPSQSQHQQQQLLVNQQRINECAGIPLISNAGNHLTHAQRHRLLRKSGKLWPSTSAGHSMSQLAAHAQGQPLLQNSKQHHAHLQQQQQQQQLQHQSWPAHAISYQPMRLNSSNNNNNFQLTDKSRTLRYQNSAPAALNTQEQQQNNNASRQSNNNTGQDQALTVTESCLPRIIKPRKRRKKDRKPTNGVLLTMDELQPKQQQQHQHQHQHQQQQQYGQLLPNMMQHDHSHGVCFCRDCDPLRSLWDYPMLRRSHSDASGGGTTTTSSSSTHSDNSCASSICSQSLPVNGSNQFDEETEHFAPITGNSSRAEIVGVIGSKRSNNAHTATATTATTTAPAALYLSDSNDSGYGDILSGMNIANDLFASCFNHSTNATSCNSNNSSSSNTNAETLLNESINEISRKLIETCAVNELPTCKATQPPSSSQGLDGCSYDTSDNSCSASASDSGLDSAGSYSSEALVFNFEHLNLMDKNLKTPTTADFHDCNNNHINAAERKQQFYNNCFDLVWRSSNNNNDSQVTAATPTATTLILGTVGKLKPAFSTIS